MGNFSQFLLKIDSQKVENWACTYDNTHRLIQVLTVPKCAINAEDPPLPSKKTKTIFHFRKRGYNLKHYFDFVSR